MKRSINRVRKRIVVPAVIAVSGLLGWATNADAITWQRYKTTTSQIAEWPTVHVSSGSYNQSIYNAEMLACSGGSWTKYINIEVSGSIPYSYQGTGCSSIGPGSFAVASSRSVCSDKSGGNNYAECWILRV